MGRKGEENPNPAVSLQGNGDRGVVCIWEINLCVCALVYFLFISQQDKKLDKQYEENTKSLFCPSVSRCLNTFLQPPPPAGARHTDLRETLLSCPSWCLMYRAPQLHRSGGSFL